MNVVPLRGLPDQDRLPPSGSELRRAIGSCRQAFIGVALMSGMINLLYLTGSFFMLEVYDRVLPSRSVPTLVGLLVIAAVLYVFQGLLDICRGRVLTRIGGSLDERLHERVYDVLIRQPLKKRTTGDGLQAIRDLDQIRQFLSGIGPTALFDLPLMPLYLAICFLFHPWIGVTAVAGALVLVAITLATEWRTRQPTKTASESATTRNALALASRRNAEVLQAMGMGRRTGALWSAANERFIEAQQRSSDVAGGLGAVSKVMRMALQSAILGVGAYLVIEQQATAGVIIASSILTSRALAPVELAIANWRGFVAARQSWKRLRELFAALPEQAHPLALPRPSVSLSVEGASAIPPGGQRFVLQDASFSLKAGDGLGVIGASASGKSSLARVLVGVWAPVRGKVRLDGAALDQDLILRLPDGYETQIGEAGTALSAGQCQRVALARALYGDPFLIVLDEPNSNLDAEGEQALTQAILLARARGRIVVVIAHRPSALAAVDLVLVMAEGRAQAFGPKDEVLSKVLRRGAGSGSAAPAQPALKVVESQRAAS